MNNMRYREHNIKKWITRELLIPCQWNTSSEPFISHLIGTDRAFGVFFPEFFLPCDSYSRPLAEQIAKTHVAARIVLIADDALRDDDYLLYPRKKLESILSGSITLFNRCLKEIGINEISRKKIISRHRVKTNRAYSMPPPNPPELTHTCKRCSWFYAAFDALCGTVCSNSLTATKRNFTKALYTLQLADDYADYDQDMESGNPYNVMSLDKEKGRINSKERQWLQGYASFAISHLCQDIMSETPKETPLHNWAKIIYGLISVPQEITVILSNYSSKYLSPIVCGNLIDLPFEDVQFSTMNGVILNAESINIYATLRALSNSRAFGFNSV